MLRLSGPNMAHIPTWHAQPVEPRVSRCTPHWSVLAVGWPNVGGSSSPLLAHKCHIRPQRPSPSPLALSRPTDCDRAFDCPPAAGPRPPLVCACASPGRCPHNHASRCLHTPLHPQRFSRRHWHSALSTDTALLNSARTHPAELSVPFLNVV